MAFGGRSQMKMSEETFGFVCTACKEDKKTVEAVKYCIECGTYCCQPCTDAHKKFPMLRNHNLIDVSQGNQASNQPPSLLEIPTERCRIHKAKVVDMYCEHHEAVGCSTCFVKDHKSCPDSHIHFIPDMIDTIFKLSDCKQTHSLLKGMVISMETVSKSKDVQLQTLKKTKTESLDKIDVFQKALEAVVRKISEASRKKVEAAYKERETEILKDKHNVDSIRNELQTTDDKLEQSEENRAQRFVCTKLAQESLTQAEHETRREELQDDTDIPITFTPDQSLLEYINAVQGIGLVQKSRRYNVIPDQSFQSSGQVRKSDDYKIKRSFDIPFKLPDDSEKCNARGCCLPIGSHLLVTDANNKKLKLIDIQKMSVVDYCTLDSEPYGLCCINEYEVAVACQRDNKILFVSMDNKMTPTRQIQMTHVCNGIAFKDDMLYVTNKYTSLFVYDMNGSQLKRILQDKVGKRLFSSTGQVAFNESGNRMFVCDSIKGLVCFDGMCNYLYTIKDKDLNYQVGVCDDGKGKIFVAGFNSHTVVRFNENGKKLDVVAKRGDGIFNPQSVCFHQDLNTLFVTTYCSDVVKMFELE